MREVADVYIALAILVVACLALAIPHGDLVDGLLGCVIGGALVWILTRGGAHYLERRGRL